MRTGSLRTSKPNNNQEIFLQVPKDSAINFNNLIDQNNENRQVQEDLITDLIRLQ